MEFKPQSENGKRLSTILANWISKSPELVVERLKRMFLASSMKVKNEDGFVAVLYGQNVLDEPSPHMIHKFPTTLLRVQHAIDISLSKRCVKELVVALELSGNETFLAEAFKWAEKYSDIAESMTSLSIDLAPERVQRRTPLSKVVAGKMTPRHREISWKGENKLLSVLEVCHNQILAGWSNGQVGIYSSVDLCCQMVLSYCKSEASVTCLQCTCTEIIVGYSDGNICVWNLEKKSVAHTLPVGESSDHPRRMKWRDPKLVVVVGAGKATVQIWQYLSSRFTLLGSWYRKTIMIQHVDCNENYIVLQPHPMVTRSAHIKYFNGQQVNAISAPSGKTICMPQHENYLITAGMDRFIQIWDIRTGMCFRRLEGHEASISTFHACDNVIASCDDSGWIMLWSAKAALEGKDAKIGRFTHPLFRTASRVKVGLNFLAASEVGLSEIVVMDFPA